MSVELNNADHDLLEKALKKLGYTVTRNGKSLSFKSGNGQITGQYVGDKLVITTPNKQVKVDTAAIKVEYSREVTKKVVKRAADMGWKVKKINDNEWEVEAPAGGNTLQA